MTQHKYHGKVDLALKVQDIDWAKENNANDVDEQKKLKSINTRIKNIFQESNIVIIYDLLKCREQRVGKLCKLVNPQF